MPVYTHVLEGLTYALQAHKITGCVLGMDAGTLNQNSNMPPVNNRSIAR
jgi:hypothetical protein